MGFRAGAWASVWSVEEGRGNSKKVRISTSHKRKDTEEYEQDFSGFCMFIGPAKNKAATLKPKDRIKLGDVDVTTWYNKEKGIEYVTYKVFDFEPVASNNTTTSTPMSADIIEDGDVDEDDLPF